MNDDQVTLSPSDAEPIDEGSPEESDAGTGSGKVFDITPDLNISPIDSDEPIVPPKADPNSVEVPRDQLLDQLIRQHKATVATQATVAKQAFSTPAPDPVVNAEPSPIVMPTPIIGDGPIASIEDPDAPIPKPNLNIPLQDISAPLEKAKAAPANPPVKQRVFPEQSFNSENAVGDVTLKGTIASILSKDLRVPEAVPPIPAPLSDSGFPPPPNLNGTTPLPNEAQKSSIPQDPNLKPLRTYEGDVAELLARRGTSRASIAIAESVKETKESTLSTKPPTHTLRNLLFGLLSIIIVGAGLYGAYYLYSISPLAPSKPVPVTSSAAPSLIPADSQTVVTIDNLNATDVATKVRAEMAKPQSAGTIREIIFSQSKNDQPVRVGAPDMATLLNTNAPNILTRSFTKDWMLGIYADANGNTTAFIDVTTDFFQNAFAGMLQWESYMADDLKLYLFPTTPSGVANIPVTTAPVSVDQILNSSNILPSASSSKQTTIGTTTKSKTATSTSKIATSTPNPIVTELPVRKNTAVTGHFTDKIILSKDVRAFVTSDGKTLFLYSFVDNTHLVMAGSEAALAEILTRLEKQAYVR